MPAPSGRLQEGGVDNVIETAKKLGITTLAQHFDPTFGNHPAVTYGASIATGGANIRAVDMAYMDATIANMGEDGRYAAPTPKYVELKNLKSTRPRYRRRLRHAPSGRASSSSAGTSASPARANWTRSSSSKCATRTATVLYTRAGPARLRSRSSTPAPSGCCTASCRIARRASSSGVAAVQTTTSWPRLLRRRREDPGGREDRHAAGSAPRQRHPRNVDDGLLARMRRRRSGWATPTTNS